MTVSIPDRYEKFIAEQVQAGRFPDAQAVVLEALAAMQEAEPIDNDAEVDQLLRGMDREWLKKEVAIAIDESNRGLVAPRDIEEIKAEGRRLLAESRAKIKMG